MLGKAVQTDMGPKNHTLDVGLDPARGVAMRTLPNFFGHVFIPAAGGAFNSRFP